MTGMLTRDLDHRQAAALMRSKWGWFLALGVVVILCGLLAIALPAVSDLVASRVLGIVLALAGIVKIVQAMQVRQWSGFVWQELTGAVELVGGILIYFNPVKGALAIALLIGLVLFIQGIGQCAVAFKVKPEVGWRWLLVSGLVSLLASAAVTVKLPYVRFYAPGTIAGIALLIAGCAYVIIAFAIRESRA